LAHGPQETKAVLVCIVEDEAFIRMEAIDLISDAGFMTVDAGNADDAIKLLETRTDIRVIVTDIDLPGTMDGLRMAHAIRKRWPPIEIIILSGQIKPTAADIPLRGVFFAKPYDPDLLLAEIRQFTA
jgi:two-component system, response regulator PdtaR